MSKYNIRDLSQEEASKYFSYVEETGLFTWKLSIGKKVKVGNVAGSISNYGYKQVKLNGYTYLVHRVIWVLLYGKVPDYIDHVDGNRINNAKNNLRECTASQNHLNRGYQGNTTGIKGITFNKQKLEYAAGLKVGNKRYRKSISLCGGRTEEDILTYLTKWIKDKRVETCGEFVRHE